MIILGNLIHAFGNMSNPHLFFQIINLHNKIVYLIIVDNVIDSKLYFLLFLLVVGKHEGFYELGVEGVVDYLGAPDLDVLVDAALFLARFLLFLAFLLVE
jgi:hypothetical protein